MRVASWNVNGLRSVITKGFPRWLKRCGADVIGLQEVRAREEQLEGEVRHFKGWHRAVVSAEKPGYSGVALLSRTPPDEMAHQLGRNEFDCEGRFQLARFGRLRVVNAYFPNGSGKDRDNSRIPYKLDFYRCLFEKLEPLRRDGTPVLVMGDFNTAHREIDLARPKQNRATSGFCPEECEEFDRWLRAGWVDTFRKFQPETAGHYTWWSQRPGVRAKNIGWRIDYVLASPGVIPYLRNATIEKHVKGSDHCPVTVELDDAVRG